MALRKAFPKFFVFALSILVLSGVWRSLAGDGAPSANGVLLPGARPEIDAGRFPSLQAALDALPATPPLDTRCLRIAAESSRITVTGNSFCDSYIGEGAVKRKVGDQLAGGIVLEGTRDVNVTGNTFSSVPKALELRGAPSGSTIFANNLLTDSPSDYRNLPADGVAGNLESPGQ